MVDEVAVLLARPDRVIVGEPLAVFVLKGLIEFVLDAVVVLDKVVEPVDVFVCIGVVVPKGLDELDFDIVVVLVDVFDICAVCVA